MQIYSRTSSLDQSSILALTGGFLAPHVASSSAQHATVTHHQCMLIARHPPYHQSRPLPALGPGWPKHPSIHCCASPTRHRYSYACSRCRCTSAHRPHRAPPASALEGKGEAKLLMGLSLESFRRPETPATSSALDGRSGSRMPRRRCSRRSWYARRGLGGSWGG